MWLADLLALWQAHGTGLVAKHALLHFQDGALTAPSPASGYFSPPTEEQPAFGRKTLGPSPGQPEYHGVIHLLFSLSHALSNCHPPEAVAVQI